MKIRFTRTTAAEIDEIFSYIARDNPMAATAVIKQIDRTIFRLAKFPAIGRVKYEPAVRMLPVGRFRSILFSTRSKTRRSSY